jgi:hypothetical protein
VQNGQFFASVATTLSRRNSFGRFPRSVEMITHRPVIGSFRNSGNSILLECVPSNSARAAMKLQIVPRLAPL